MENKNDINSKKEIIQKYNGVIHTEIKKNSLKAYEWYDVHYEDLVQPGLYELHKAIKSFEKK